MNAIRAGILAFAIALYASAAPADDWPSRPVRILNGFAAGGAADVLARTVADGLSAAFKQQFFVETRAGAGGLVAAQQVAKAEPDGYNLGITTLSLLVLAPIINPNGGFDGVRELTNIAYLAGSPIVLVVNRALGVTTLRDFIAYGKASAKPLTYSSSGLGSNGQLVAVSFAQAAGIAIEHVPYKGAAQGIMDLVGGQIIFSSQTLSSSSGQIRGGALVALAHSGAERMADYPDVPTFREEGYDVVSTNWFALSGPPGLPADIARKINRAVVGAMTKPETQHKMRQDSLVVVPMDNDAFARFIGAESVRWKPVVERAGLVQR